VPLDGQQYCAVINIAPIPGATASRKLVFHLAINWGHTLEELIQLWPSSSSSNNNNDDDDVKDDDDNKNNNNKVVWVTQLLSLVRLSR